MPISFTDSRKLISTVAEKQRAAIGSTGEVLAFDEAIGRIASKDVLSPIATPPFDSSAMDGYAVCSAQTIQVSRAKPLFLRVVGLVVAGDAALKYDDGVVDGLAPCVEIMTGAPFPRGMSNELHFDACIPYEQVLNVAPRSPSMRMESKVIQITHPVAYNQHRRFAGSDFRRDNIIISRGITVAHKHVMAAASVGIKSIWVVRRIRVGVLSTGSELLSHEGGSTEDSRSIVPDVNGPYLCSVIRGLGADIRFLGSFGDDMDALLHQFQRSCASRLFDILVSSGAVSAGRLDHIPRVVEALNGCIHFHHVALRPGHPVLFASLPTRTMPVPFNVDTQHIVNEPHESPDVNTVAEVPFFGLPGNPVAAAACLRFLFVPYVIHIQGASERPGVPATIRLKSTQPNDTANPASPSSRVVTNPKHLDQFLLGNYKMESGSIFVEASMERSPAKIHPYLAADCWIHVPGHRAEINAGDILQTYPLSSPSNTI